VKVSIGPYTFDNVSYDAEADVHYLHMGDPSTAADFDESPEVMRCASTLSKTWSLNAALAPIHWHARVLEASLAGRRLIFAITRSWPMAASGKLIWMRLIGPSGPGWMRSSYTY
jgi:hypothetical protein